MIKNILKEHEIEYFSVLPIEEAEIINPRLMPKDCKSVIIFLVPYKNSFPSPHEIARFARIKDYHIFAKEFLKKITPRLEGSYPCDSFYIFSDHSPINERRLAEKGGIGHLGDNGLIINEKYGTYVFLAEIFTTAALKEYVMETENLCSHCKMCIKSCPSRENCLSEITQKKNKTNEDREILKENHAIWGCDICQAVCPANKNAKNTPFNFFNENHILTPKEILKMSDEQFSKYPFAYRGRKAITENILSLYPALKEPNGL